MPDMSQGAKQTRLHCDFPEFEGFLYETRALGRGKSSSKLQGSPAWQPISGICQTALVPSTTANKVFSEVTLCGGKKNYIISACKAKRHGDACSWLHSRQLIDHKPSDLCC